MPWDLPVTFPGKQMAARECVRASISAAFERGKPRYKSYFATQRLLATSSADRAEVEGNAVEDQVDATANSDQFGKLLTMCRSPRSGRDRHSADRERW